MSETETKSKPATARKLQKQRREGNIAQSSDLSNLTASAIGMVFCAVILSTMLERFHDSFGVAGDGVTYDFLAALRFVVPTIGAHLTYLLAPLAAVVVTVSILITLLYNKGFVFSLKPAAPQLQRVSPMAGLKRIYGKRGWVELFQSILRLFLWFGLAVLVIWSVFRALFRLDTCGVSCVVNLSATIALILMGLAFALMLIAAGFDMIIQKFLYLGEQKMSNTEVKQEQKEQFGTREVRQERNRLRSEQRRQSGPVGVLKGNMCIYFEERCAVIRFHPEEAPVPILTAKGKTQARSNDIRAQMAQYGFPETQSKAFIHATKSLAPGNALPQETHPDFIEALQAMFG